MATLLFRITGPNGLYALRQMLYLPRESYLYDRSVIAAFDPVILKPLWSYVQGLVNASVVNFLAFFFEPVLRGKMT